MKRTLAAIAGVLALTAACSSQPPEEKGGKKAESITVWTPFVDEPRIKAQEETAAKFTAKTGIKVKIVGMDAADQETSLVTGAASGKVPDTIIVAPSQVTSWHAQGLLDVDAPGQVVEELGADTFVASSKRLITVDGKLGAVPTDGWGHLLFYRKDLLQKAGQQPPTSIDQVATAATAMAKDGKAGIALGTKPADPFATESLEAMLLPNGCQLATAKKVTINSPACVNGLKAYGEMAQAAGKGEFDVEGARAAYLKGDAAMLIFSSHFLDELAGMDEANPVTCAECKKDKDFLRENTGISAALTGPDNTTPTQYGLTINYVVPKGAHTEEAKQFISFMLSEGYMDTLGTATEGRIPMRVGTKENPTEFVDAWSKLPFGTEKEKSINEVYGQETVDLLVKGAQSFQRWGAGTEDAALAGAVYTQNALSKEIGPLTKGGDPAEVAKTMADEVTKIQQDLGE